MTGKVLQERIAAVSNIPFNTIAERIGVSSQSMYQFFTAKDVKSGLIEKVCEVLNIDVATLYGQEPVQGISHNAGDVITGDNVANRVNEESKQMITILDEQLKVKDEQIRVRDEQIGKLINIINK